MTLPAFEVLQPESLQEALAVLAANPRVHPVCGGTNLIVDVRAGKIHPETVVDLSRLDALRGITVSEDEIRIGAATPIAEIERNQTIRRCVPLLAACCKTFANTLIRNRATIGGNLVNAAPCADTAPALLVLDAQVELTSASGARWVPLEEFLVGAFQTTRRSDELLTTVRFPLPPANALGGFRKMGLRKISCMAKVDVAVYLELDDNGVCRKAHIALGAAAPVALRAEEAEEALKGQLLTAEAAVPAKQGLTGEPLVQKTIEEAARLTAESTLPRAGSEYKRQVVYGLTRRILTACAKGGNR